MLMADQTITVFEHTTLKSGVKYGSILFDEAKLKALQKFYGEKGVPYFSLVHNGVRFNEHVGVLQVGTTIFEILPKADKDNADNSEANWRNVLIGMLLKVGVFEVHAPTQSALNLKPKSILDLYFQLFISELERLIHIGLIKKYRKIESNTTALKGSLKFSQHIMQNLVHQERFFVSHTVYDTNHQLHYILYKTLNLIKLLNTSNQLSGRINQLLLHFPEMPDIKVTEKDFEQIIFNRKTLHYKNATAISRILLLQYHPDLSKSKNDVLALMFNMNVLWEKFIYITLRKAGFKSIADQSPKSFWSPDKGVGVGMRPDIVINKNLPDCIVLDTKWKNLNSSAPTVDDLRQMFVYHEYFQARKVGLLYPGKTNVNEGTYVKSAENRPEYKCSILSIDVSHDLNKWQEDIRAQVKLWAQN